MTEPASQIVTEMKARADQLVKDLMACNIPDCDLCNEQSGSVAAFAAKEVERALSEAVAGSHEIKEEASKLLSSGEAREGDSEQVSRCNPLLLEQALLRATEAERLENAKAAEQEAIERRRVGDKLSERGYPRQASVEISCAQTADKIAKTIRERCSPDMGESTR